MLCALFLLFAFISTEVESLQLPSPQRIPPKPTSDSLEEVALAEAKCGSLILPNIAHGTINWGEFSEPVESYPAGQFWDVAERYSTSPMVALGMGWGTTEELFKGSCSGQTVGTKFTPTPWRKKPSDVVDAALRSCERLGVDQIPLYSIHMPDLFANGLDKVYWDGMIECVNLGIVANAGVSNYGSTLLRKAHGYFKDRGVDLAANQIHYSLLYNDKSEACRKTAEELGIATFGYQGLAMGLLTGSYNKYYIMKHLDEYGLTASDGYRLVDIEVSMPSKFKKNGRSFLETRDLQKYAATSGVDALVAEMVKVAIKHKKTVAQVAINYCVTKGVIPIVGCSTLSQFHSNLEGGGSWRLDADDLARLERVQVAKFDGAGFKRSEGKFVGYGEKKWSLE